MTDASSARIAVIGEFLGDLRTRVIPTAREIGDVRRNCALWLARQTATYSSSFAKGLPNRLEPARLGEVPYLAAIGYLCGCGLLPSPADEVGAALQRLSTRSTHTSEKTGIGDDLLCASGLLLAARAYDDNHLAQRLSTAVDPAAATDPALRLVAALANPNAKRCPTVIDQSSLSDIAVALIASKVDPRLGAELFPGANLAVLEHRLLTLITEQHPPTADLNAMLALAALEATLSVPEPGSLSENAMHEPTDIAILVPLKEEFRVLFDRIKGSNLHVEDGGRAYYVFDGPAPAEGPAYRCVATMMGEMGTERAGVIAEKILGRWQPSIIVMIGIAGGIHGDVKLGDVVVASEVNNYMAGAKASGGSAPLGLQRAGDAFKADHGILDRVRNFEFSNSGLYSHWRTNAMNRRTSDAEVFARALADGMVRQQPDLKDGHIASGPAVIACKEAVEWLRQGDRSILAVEMEAGGLMVASHMSTHKIPALVLRGISDFGDDRKSKLDATGEGAFRRYAMGNATDLLWSIMAAGLLPRSTSRPSADPARGGSPEEQLLAVLGSHADANGEVTATWRTIREWLGPGCAFDPHQIAIHLNDDGYFRSAQFDYDLCGVVIRR